MSAKSKEIFKTYRFPIILIISIVLGSIIGLIFGEKAVVLKPFGDVFLNLMFTIVVPLVFVTITSAVSKMADMKRLGKILGNLLLVFMITGMIASVVMIFTVKILPPAQGVDLSVGLPEVAEKLNLGDQIVKAITVGDFTGLLSKRNMLPLIFFFQYFSVYV